MISKIVKKLFEFEDKYIYKLTKYNEDEIFELSRTLGFSKNANTDIIYRNEINVESIMADIRKHIKLKGAKNLWKK